VHGHKIKSNKDKVRKQDSHETPKVSPHLNAHSKTN